MGRRSGWLFVSLGFATLLLLAYVHEQITIYKVSYAIEAKERKLATLQEAFKKAQFKLDQLRSPASLSQRAKEASLELVVPSEHEVVQVFKMKHVQAPAERTTPFKLPYMSFFQLVRVAQAKE